MIKQKIKDHLSAKEITLLIGARQVGKTTVLKEISKELKSDGQNVLFLNLDFESDFSFFENQNKLLQKIKLEIGSDKGFVFIDEIQRKENAGLFLKGLYDQDLPYKFIVSGSGSLELKEKIHESLAGRKRIFELPPVSITEFIHYKTAYKYQNKLAEWLDLNHQTAQTLLIEYLNFGGYPRIITAEQSEEKILLLEEIFQSYLEKDISFLLGLEKTNAFILMIRLLADRIGQLINYSGLSVEIGLSTPTLKKYLWYAEKTFVLHSIVPFFRNATKELIKSPQVYFNDLGLRNFSLNNVGKIIDLSQAGFLFQNFIFHLLREKYSAPNRPLKYWRSKDKAEVDFILEQGLIPLPIEVKCKDLKRPTVSLGFRSFIKRYRPKEAWLVNLSLQKDIEIEGTIVKIFPWYHLL